MPALTETSLDSLVDRVCKPWLREKHSRDIVIGVLSMGTRHVFSRSGTQADVDSMPNEKSVFEIGSVTKLFTATLLASGCDQGAVRLTDPVEAWLPELRGRLRFGDRQVTLLHLATHTSRLPRQPSNLEDTISDADNPYANYGPDQLLDYLSKMRLRGPIGARVHYSNVGFDLLGVILERVSGRHYSDLVSSTILAPLEMRETGIDVPDSAVVPGYEEGQRVRPWDMRKLPGAGGLRSSVADLLTFLAAHLDERQDVLGRSLALAIAPHRIPGSPSALPLGWQLDAGVFWHNGGTAGHSSYVALDPDRNLAVAVLTNCDSSVDGVGRQLMRLIR